MKHTSMRRALAGTAALLLAMTITFTGFSRASAESASAAEQILAGMTLEQKVCQVFIVRPEALWPGQYREGFDPETLQEQPGYSLTRLTDEMRAGLSVCPVGGVAIFGQNLESPEQLAQFTADLQAASQVPLFLAVDEEGGSVARLANSGKFDVPQVGSMADVGATGDPQRAYEVGQTIGAYISRYGLNLDFAPVADVNTNPDNIVIGNRAFGSDPELVARMVPQALAGMHASGVMGCVKHFPGHGDTSADTHDGYVSVEKNWVELRGCELIPFMAALDTADMVMMAHITAPNVTSDGLPASLSAEMIQGKLRGELGYDGVVITDACEMGAVADNYSSGEAAVLALQAGADIVLMPRDLDAACLAVRDAVRSGALPLERLEESVLRILRLKEKYGLLGA